MALKVGDKIPEILGYDQTGKELKREDFKGKKLVLYFYPKDNTPGCTAEAAVYEMHIQNCRKAGYEIIGVSKDNEKSHQKFIEKQSLPFSLIADTEVRLNQEFGVWAEKKDGREILYGNFKDNIFD